MTDHAAALDHFTGEIHLSLYNYAQRFAKEHGLATDTVYADIVTRLVENLPQSVKNASDKRAAAYRVRLTLFAQGGLVADSDPELVVNAPGTEIIYGLQGVAQWARDIILGFHPDEPIGGLEDDTLIKSIKSLRPSLSRNGGAHNWRLPYTVDGHEGYLANILVVTEPD